MGSRARIDVGLEVQRVPSLHRCVADVELGYSLCVCRGDNGD